MGDISLSKPSDSASRVVAGRLGGEEQLRPFIRDGRIAAMPARPAKRRLLLDCVAQAFEPGLRFPEDAVDDVLKMLCDDYSALRRYLVDEGFLSRQAGVYWRSGGTVDIRPGTADAGPEV